MKNRTEIIFLIQSAALAIFFSTVIFLRMPSAGQVWKMKNTIGNSEIYILEVKDGNVKFIQAELVDDIAITMPEEFFKAGATKK